MMLKKTVIAASLLLAGGFACGPPAHAGYIVTLTQAGSNVVANGSGTIDLTGLTFSGSETSDIGIIPSDAELATGTPGNSVDLYTGFTGPASFGSGGPTLASSGSGDIVGIFVGSAQLGVPEGYVSGNALSDSSTYDNQTFASLGVTPGTYVWTWGGPPDDTFTLDIKTAAVPEPGSLVLLATALIGLGAAGWSRRRRA